MPEVTTDLAAIESAEANAAVEAADIATVDLAPEAAVTTKKIIESSIEALSETVKPSLKHKSPYLCTREDVDLLDPEAVAKIRYDASKFLYGYLAKIAAQNDNENELVELTVDKAIFVFSPDKKTVKTNLSGSKLYALSSVPIYEESANISGRKEAWDTIIGKQYLAKELLWDTAIWAARCRLELGTDLNKPVALAHWPNMTRLRNFPHAVQVAALWIKQPTSLIDTTTLLEIPQRDVFSFYVATQAIGESYYVEDVNKKTTPVKRKKNSFFSRILEHLKGTDEIDEKL